MIIEKTDSEIVIRIPSYVNVDDVQHIIDWMICKETVARSRATQEEIDRIARESKKGWWQQNRAHYIK
jgi:hypothetical protein